MLSNTVVSRGATVAKLEDLRRRKRLTREQLAVQAGVSAKTLYTLERSDPPPVRIQLRVMNSVAAALGVDPSAVDEFKAALGVTD